MLCISLFEKYIREICFLRWVDCIVNIAINCLHIIDIITDVIASIQYYIEGNLWWGSISVIVMTLTLRFFVVFQVYQPTPTLGNFTLMYIPGLLYFANKKLVKSTAVTREAPDPSVIIHSSDVKVEVTPASTSLARKRNFSRSSSIPSQLASQLGIKPEDRSLIPSQTGCLKCGSNLFFILNGLYFFERSLLKDGNRTSRGCCATVQFWIFTEVFAIMNGLLSGWLVTIEGVINFSSIIISKALHPNEEVENELQSVNLNHQVITVVEAIVESLPHLALNIRTVWYQEQTGTYKSNINYFLLSVLFSGLSVIKAIYTFVRNRTQILAILGPTGQLRDAIENGDYDGVTQLLKSEPVLVNLIDLDGKTPILWVLESSPFNLKIIEALLSEPAIDINLEDKWGFTPVMWAAQLGRKRIGNQIISKETSITNKDGNTPLHYASQKGYINVVEALLKVPGIEVNKKDKNGQTPLLWASEKGHINIVEALLKVPGIEVNKGNNKYGHTPLHRASQNGHINVVEALLKMPSIEVNKEDKTPLHYASEKGHINVVEALLKVPGIEVNNGDKNNGRTPLHYASQNGHINVVEALLKVPGIEVNNDGEQDGNTPLHYASEKGHINVVEALLKVPGIEVNKEDKHGWTPLHRASQNGHINVVEALLKVPSIEVNKKDKDGETPLQYAIMGGREDVIQVLANLGAR